MTRPSIDAVMMQTARAWASRGTCSRLQVGAVAARYGRVIVTGYNGTVAGAPHCDHTCHCAAQHGFFNGEHAVICKAIRPCTEAVHAEANVVAFAARLGLQLFGATLYCTHAPCLPCARLLVNAGITDLIFAEHYGSTGGLQLLLNNGVEVGPWAPSEPD